MESAEQGDERLCDDLPKCEPTASSVRAQRADQAHREFEGDSHGRFDGGHRGAQCSGLLEIAVRLASRQRELVLELPCRLRSLGPLSKKPVGSVEQ